MNISIRFTRPTIKLLIRHLEQAYATGNLRLVRRISAFNQYFPEYKSLASSVEDTLAYFARRVDEIKSLIQVNGIAPGYFVTEMTKALVEDGQFDAWVRAPRPSQSVGSSVGADRSGSIPRLRRVELRERAHPIRRRWDAGVCLK